MKRAMLFALVIMFACSLSFTALWAQEKKPEAKQETAATMDAKEKADFSNKVSLFYQVVSYGESQKDPLVLLTAVKLLDDLPFKGIAKPGQDEKVARYDRATLLNEAKQFAAGDDDLLSVIAKVQDPPEKTAVRYHGGPHGDYYGRHHHRRHYECVWFQVCRHHHCEWVCR